MNSLVHASLGEVAKLNPSFKSKAASPDELVDFLPMSAVRAEFTTVRATEQRQLCEVQKGHTNFSDGDVLLAKITPCFENGKIAFVNLNTAHGFGSTEFHVIRANSERLDGRYLVHFLRRDEIRVDGARNMTGSAGQRRVPKHYLQSLSIPLPPLSEQRRIAAILDQADALRAKRREALAQLDSLTQSIFIEMFGNPVTNPKGWPTVNLGALIHSASDGPHVSPTYADTGVPFLSTRHVRPGEIRWSDLKYLTQDEAEIQWKKCKPSRDDILYTKGGTTGLAAVVRTDDEFAVWVHVALLRPNKKLVDSTWLEAMLNSQYCYRQSQELTFGIANRDLGLKRMVKILMYHPPLELQREFTRHIERLVDQKKRLQLSLAELDTLFASLQHGAFRGEL